MNWRDLPEKTAQRFDLPADAVAGLPKLTVTGMAQLVIENHKGLLEYGESLIEVSGGKIRIRVNGAGLELRAMTQTEMIITGQIGSIELI